MAEYTTHYNLKKPAKNENYNIDVANQNNDIIDEKLYGKVDKKAGKDLSTNDFTNEYKKKLDTLKNYDDAEVIKQITSFNERAGKVEEANTEISKNVEALKTDNETNKTAISELKETTAQNSETITAIQEEQTTQNENIEKNAEGIAQNKKDVDEELTKIKKENKLLKAQIPEGQASGNNIHLEDSSNMPLEWRLNGGSKQEITGGYNLCKSSSYNDSNLMLFFNPADITNKTITISLETNVELLGNSIYINSPIDAFHRLVAAISGRANERITSTFTLKDDDYAEIKNLREPRFLIYKDEAGFNEVINPQIVLGDIDKLYEPYTGGTPSPNPKYPSKIENVENDVKMTVYNKNLFDGNFTTNGIWNDDGSINYVIQSKLYWRTDFIKIPNTKIYFSDKMISSFSSAILLEFDAKRKFIALNKIYQVNSNLNKVSLNSNTKYIAIQWNLQQGNEITNIFTELQIEENTAATDYIPHEEQSIIFPLAEGQKLRSLPNGVKDYLAEDGIHKNVGIIILNGSGGANESYFKALDNKFALGINTEKGLLLRNLKTDNLKISVLSDKFLGVPWNIMKDTIEGWQIALRQDGSYTYLRLLTTGIKDTKALETFLQNNNAIVAYPLAEEEIIPYTPEQQKVIDTALYTYKNITNISLDNELAMLDITYKKNIETMFNNQAKEYNERLSNIENLLSTTSTSALLLDNLENDLKEEV